MNPNPGRVFAQSGVVPYRIKNGNIEVLLITTERGRRWIIPKGLVEDAMTAADSAAKEAWEEAGISGRVSPKLMGTYEYRKWGGICRVEVFLLQVETMFDDWPESRMRKRQWFSLAEAVNRLEEAELKQILGNLPELIQ